MKKKHTKWESLLYLAGVSPKYEGQITASDLIKIRLMGITPFLPTLFAFIASGYGISTYYTESPILVWGFAAPLCALVVFVIELVIAASISPGTPSLKKWMIALPRITLSVLLSITMAMPLKLAIFSGPVKREMLAQRDAVIAEKRGETSPELERKKRAHEHALTRQQKQEEECRLLESEYLGEIDGNRGSHTPGLGAIGKVKEQSRNRCLDTEATYTAEANRTFLAYEQVLLDQAIANELAVTEYKEHYTTDLVAQLQALGAVTQKNPSVKFFGIIIIALFTLLDLIPTFNKLTASVPSYVVAENIDLQKKQAEQKALSHAFSHIVREHSQSLMDAATRKREVHTYHNMLKANRQMQDLAFHVKQQLETKSILHQTSAPLDVGPFEQTALDINAFNAVTNTLRKTGTDPCDPTDYDSGNPDVPPTDEGPDKKPPPDKPFVLKRIV